MGPRTLTGFFGSDDWGDLPSTSAMVRRGREGFEVAAVLLAGLDGVFFVLVMVRKCKDLKVVSESFGM